MNRVPRYGCSDPVGRWLKMIAITASLGVGALSGVAWAYPGAQSGGEHGCSTCHNNPEYGKQLTVKFLRQVGGQVVDDFNQKSGKIVTPLRKGSKTSYKLVLGAATGKIKVLGWLWITPPGVWVDAPGGIRKPNQGQPWNEYVDENGMMVKHDGVSVIDQTIFFGPSLTDPSTFGALYIALGLDDKGAGGLSGTVIQVEFEEGKL